MDIDFSTLAARIAADIQDLRGCVIVSRDGLVLGSHPSDAENILRPAWLRFASLGDVEKGFIQFSGELWVYVRRGPYASFAVSNSVSRPGLLLDELEHVLLAAEEARSFGQVAAGSGGGGLPGSRPRTSLHPDAKPSVASSSQARSDSASDAGFAELAAMAQSRKVEEEGDDTPTVILDQAPAAPQAAAPQAATPQAAAPQAATPQAAAPQAEPIMPPAPTQDLYAQYSPPGKAVPEPAPGREEPSEHSEPSEDVDRFALAQEFAQLLGDSGYDEPAEED